MKPDPTLAGYLRPPAAAEYMGLSVRHVRALTRRRVLPVIRLGKRCALYARADLDRALAKFRVSAVGGE